MNPHAIVVGGKLTNGLAQMPFTKHDQVVETFPPDRADQSLCATILPRRTWRNRFVTDAQGL
jgi:hypothetical protein